jgi:transcriptional regulator with XRE-family HTH domain
MSDPHVPKPKLIGGDLNMIQLGNIARRVRESKGISQVAAAKLLEISSVHLCNIEGDKARPSPELLARYRELWGVDLYVLAWCLSGDLDRLPASVRDAGHRLTSAWRKALGDLIVPETQ